ncbi:DUF202 domain-containing protein [uncultured Roseobacter sp.]|uniref:YidH family protein n=1 Tax=uncultured Roseobacter sp. TaxID=114847 RepID=UPI0026331BC0|nr:DUF202 domain-containing protein [uncultured Roseobacter sp.]
MPKSDLPKDPDSNDLANARTAWAEDRTVLANERTFAGWMRTGMACVALALGLRAVFNDTEYPLLAKAIAELFILSGILIFWAAAINCRKTQTRMSEHDVETQSYKRMTLLATVLTFAAASTGVILWFL